MFNNQLKDIFANHTRLSQVRRNGDLKIEGEITQYTQRNKSVSSEGHSAQTELSITVNVRFTNNTNHNEDFERSFTATKSYETTQSLNAVQEELVTQMVKDLTEQIFNATVANHPETMDKKTLYDLRNMVALYPYYQTARLLMLKNLYLLHDSSFDEELRRAAIYITNREKLFEMVEAVHYGLAPAEHDTRQPQPTSNEKTGGESRTL